MINYSNSTKKSAAVAAVIAINILPLQAGVDKTELTIRLCKYLIPVQNSKIFSPFPGRAEKKLLRDLSKEISRIQMKFDAASDAINSELRRVAFMQGKLGVVEDYRKTLKAFQDMKTLIDRMEPLKRGNRNNRVASGYGLILTELYYEATGKKPGHKSGDGSSPFYRFVEAAVASTNMNASTVTRKGVELWRDRKKDTSSTPQKTTIMNVDIYNALAKGNKKK